MSKKQQRANERIRQIIAQHVTQNLPPQLGLVSITRVELTKDLSLARVYFLVMPEQNAQKVKEYLSEHERELRSKLGSLRIRRLPKLVFEEDKSAKIARELADGEI
ncbi:MAG: ribosome-binding factor A [Aquificae bacterium]|nr:ribosome-binding factor A [Aquificota bacterium]